MGSTRIFKVLGTANVGGVYPMVGFSVSAYPNTFATATVEITSNSKDGKKFTKSTAISMATAMLRRVQKGTVKGSFSANSGAASIGFNGFITDMSANASSTGTAITVTANLISEDIQLTKFNPVPWVNFSTQGISQLLAKVKSIADELKIDSTKISPAAILTAKSKATSFADIVASVLDNTKEAAKKYGKDKAKEAIKSSEKAYNYVKAFLKNSSKTSNLFGGKYIPETPQEKALIAQQIVDGLFSSSGKGSFWQNLLTLMRYFQLCYSPDIRGGIGRINVQDYSPSGNARQLPEAMCTNIRASGSVFNQKLPASSVYITIGNGTANNPNAGNVTVTYPASAETDGNSIDLDPCPLFNASLEGINISEALVASPKKRTIGKKVTPLTKEQQSAKKKLAKIIQAARFMCQNVYYYGKYVHFNASASAYYAGVGGLEVGTRAKAGGFSGVLNNITISGSSSSGIMISAQLEGVVV